MDMKRSWMFPLAVALMAFFMPVTRGPTAAQQLPHLQLDPAHQRILEQELFVMSHPDDLEARQKLVDYATSPEDGKSLIIVGIGVQEKGRHPKQALALAARAAQADVYRWLVYHAIWQKDINVNFGSIEAQVNLKGQLLLQGIADDGRVIIVQRFPYPLKVTVTPKPKPTPTPAPTTAPSVTPAISPSPMASPSTAPSSVPPPSATPGSLTPPAAVTSPPPATASPAAPPAETTPVPTMAPASPVSPAPTPVPMTAPAAVTSPPTVASPTPTMAPSPSGR